MNGNPHLFVRLSRDCSIKLLEEPCLYNRKTDDLYMVSDESIPFLQECLRGSPRPDGAEASAFVDYCLEENLLDAVDTPADRGSHLRKSPMPSLRYLLLHVTDRCNLRCRHCFQGDPGQTDIPLQQIRRIVDEFEALQGLRLMVSGGEPLLHPDFWQLDEFLSEKDLRTILLTNGMLIDERVARRLRFQEVQVSLDGAKEAHDKLRGTGSFERAVEAIRLLVSAEVHVSVATMVHAYNLDDFDYMEKLLGDLGVREWSIDAPSAAGRMLESGGLMVDPESAGLLLGRSFGGAVHEPASGYACGAHLMAVMANGDAARCGFYAGRPAGCAVEGLAECWQRIERVKLSQLECDCRYIDDCRGGCRFRAAGYKGLYGPDPCQCFRYGVME